MLFLEKIICLEFYFLKFKIFNLWTRRSNQSILKINPGISLEGMMLKLKLQYFATSCEELTHWKRLWCWEGLGAGEEGDNRGWDGWMTSLTRWTRVWVNSGSWCWTGRPGVLRYMRSQRVGHDWATELNWTELSIHFRGISYPCPVQWTVGTEDESCVGATWCSNSHSFKALSEGLKIFPPKRWSLAFSSQSPPPSGAWLNKAVDGMDGIVAGLLPPCFSWGACSNAHSGMALCPLSPERKGD